MRILGVIPARYHSSRFPGKPLALIAGKPMIQRVIEGARSSKLLSEIIVATDDSRIQKVCEDLGCRAVMTDPELPSGTDRIEQAIRGISADGVINIQGDEPLINNYWIDPLAQLMISQPEIQMATLAHPISEDDLQNPNAVKVVVDRYGFALYFSRFPIPHSRFSMKETGRGSSKHIGMYAYRKDYLLQFCAEKPSTLERAEALEQLRALNMGTKIKVIFVEKPTLGVDTPEDLKRVEKWLKENS